MLNFTQGSFNVIRFLPYSGTISSVFRAVDDFTFKTLTVLQPALPDYNEMKYCKTLMDQCTGDAAQFASYEECTQFMGESISILDDSCTGMWGHGNSRFCRMINQYRITSDDAPSCS